MFFFHIHTYSVLLTKSLINDTASSSIVGGLDSRYVLYSSGSAMHKNTPKITYQHKT